MQIQKEFQENVFFVKEGTTAIRIQCKVIVSRLTCTTSAGIFLAGCALKLFMWAGKE